MNTGGKIKRAKIESHFTTVMNEAFQTKGLSVSAMGLLIHLLTKPSDWETRMYNLVNFFEGTKFGGETSLSSTMLELRKAGFIDYRKWQDEHGKVQHEYIVYPLPMEQVAKRFPEMLEPEPERRMATKTNEASPGFKKCSPQLDYPALECPAVDNPALLLSNELPSKKLLNLSVADGSAEAEKEPEEVKTEPPQAITVQTGTGPLKLTQSDLFLHLGKSKPDCKTSQALQAWQVLAEYPNIIYDWRGFIDGTIENFKRKDKSKHASRKQEEKRCNTQSSKSEDDNTTSSEPSTKEQALPTYRPSVPEVVLALSSSPSMKRLARSVLSKAQQGSEKPTSAQPSSDSSQSSSPPSEPTTSESS